MTGRGACSGLFVALLAAAPAGCGAPSSGPARGAALARNLVLITIDTLRADHVGVYGYAAARTATLDRLGREGVRFDRAFAPAPITLTSHASLLTGRYPPGHGARDNGVAASSTVPTLAGTLHDRGYATAAFVAAYPLDRRFGLARGFDVYGDRMSRGPDGRLASERPARVVIDEALGWLSSGRQAGKAFFLWVHLFEPHAPYGDPERDRARPLIERYDEEVATADREAGRLVAALGPILGETLIVAASDHGEAFGEHGEIGHSLFVYDTTLRVALIARGPGIPAGRVVGDPVSLVDAAPTVLRLLGVQPFDADGLDLRAAIGGEPLPPRPLYAESFAPLLEFGWSPLRAVRDGRWKAIAAPRPELYDVEADRGETRDLTARGSTPAELPRLLARIERFSGPDPPPTMMPGGAGADALARLGALGYVQGGRAPSGPRPDPKDRRDLAARIARVTSGETFGDERMTLLRAILADDPGNGQMHLRLGDELLRRSRWAEAERNFEAAVALRLPTADPYLGLAACQARAGRSAAAIESLRRGAAAEPGNPVVMANLGLLEGRLGHIDAAIAHLRDALTIDPELHEARFNLALTYARAGRRQEAADAAADLLSRLPADAPQRAEVERLVAALRRTG
jgi:choline-sulfatase